MREQERKPNRLTAGQAFADQWASKIQPKAFELQQLIPAPRAVGTGPQTEAGVGAQQPEPLGLAALPRAAMVSTFAKA
jgi:hypothetical protein